MNGFFKLSLRLVLAALMVGGAAGAPLNLKVSSERRKTEANKQQTESTNVSVEKWGYRVVIENKTFKAVEGLTAVYRVYMADDSSKGVAGKMLATPGTADIPGLKAGQKFTFDTETVVLNKTALKSGWVYTDKSKARLEDRVAGLWLRVMKDEAIIFEYMNPPTLKGKVNWE